MHRINLIFKKEMKSLFRDKKAILTILLPVLIYPVLLMFFIGFTVVVQSNLDEKISTVAVENNPPQVLIDKLNDHEKLNVVYSTNDLDSDQIDAYLSVAHVDGVENYTIEYNSTIETSQFAANRLKSVLTEYNEELKTSKLNEAGLEASTLDFVNIKSEELMGNRDDRIISMMMGMFFPFLIMLYGITGTYTIASDLSAGEKERETLETIFSVPVKRFEIIMGKLLACVNVGIISGLVNIISMFPLLYAATVAIPDININVSFVLLFYLIIMIIPVMIMTSTFFIGLGLVARTFQEAQSYGSILLILFMVPTFVVMVPDLEITNLVLSIPIANALMLMKEAFLGEYSLIRTFFVLLINLSISGAGIIIMNRLFKSDWVIFGGEKG
ncbi:MAG: ABC transporter permease subunit [Dethiosulfatibacter sp.]|nr:ABC transporter permease subunit [Dethiosulfatibacter sp.]